MFSAGCTLQTRGSLTFLYFAMDPEASRGDSISDAEGTEREVETVRLDRSFFQRQMMPYEEHFRKIREEMLAAGEDDWMFRLREHSEEEALKMVRERLLTPPHMLEANVHPVPTPEETHADITTTNDK